MSRLRWWLFKRLSAIAWCVCPEPHRTALHKAWSTASLEDGTKFTGDARATGEMILYRALWFAVMTLAVFAVGAALGRALL